MFDFFKETPVLRSEVSPVVREPVDTALKMRILSEYTSLKEARIALMEDRHFIELQIAEHDRAIAALVSALSSLETDDRLHDALTEVLNEPLLEELPNVGI